MTTNTERLTLAAAIAASIMMLMAACGQAQTALASQPSADGAGAAALEIAGAGAALSGKGADPLKDAFRRGAKAPESSAPGWEAPDGAAPLSGDEGDGYGYSADAAPLRGGPGDGEGNGLADPRANGKTPPDFKVPGSASGRGGDGPGEDDEIAQSSPRGGARNRSNGEEGYPGYPGGYGDEESAQAGPRGYDGEESAQARPRGKSPRNGDDEGYGLPDPRANGKTPPDFRLPAARGEREGRPERRPGPAVPEGPSYGDPGAPDGNGDGTFTLPIPGSRQGRGAWA
ncbi:MAG: hypothetical protein LBQ12_08245 [Deltaproteobacteria bacterium]|jgi:hypothetical protein|nr:hypothetical protein [Deltaproteobacteria bacterium]